MLNDNISCICRCAFLYFVVVSELLNKARGAVIIIIVIIPLTIVEQELLTLPEHLSSPPVLVGFVLLDL